MARIVVRRRANAEAFRKLRDRFTFQVKEMSAIATPDVFRVELAETPQPSAQPKRFIV